MSGYDFEDNFYDEAEEHVPVTLEECENCGRKFNVGVLDRHYNICSKLKKRKTFSSQKQRLEGLEKAKITTTSKPEKVPKKKVDWRRQHQEFIKTIRSARDVTAAIQTGSKLPPPPSPTINPDYVQCPHCSRRFNESAAERHIEFCKEQTSRLPKQPTNPKYSVNKEKQQKRTQYRPPLPGQRKTSESSPAKARGPGILSPATKVNSAGSNRNNLDKYSKCDSSPSRKKRNSSEGIHGNSERINSRYSKSSTYRIAGSYSSQDENPKPRSGKNSNGDPKWFEELKRGDSGKQKSGRMYDELDSGTDLNDNYSPGRYNRSKRSENHPVGVVRPSSRSNGNDISDMNEPRSGSSGRRMANFCHDCGTKYPVTCAKFCCECGVRRMSLA